MLDQGRALLDPQTTLAEVLTGGHGETVLVNGKARHVASYMKDFLFLPEQARTPVHILSGGERARLLLARLLAAPSNLLVLDEPTNDLDLETLDLLEEMIADYPGTVLLVSHDRDFLDRVTTSLLLAEGAGRFVEYAGGYSDMLRQRGAAAPKAQEKSKNADRTRAPAQKSRMTFSDRHALQTLGPRMEELEGQIAALKEKLGVPDFYKRDPQGFGAAARELESLQQELAAAEERWLALEMRREEIEG
jgi:ATP-binding cassette subfamily F protein uup